MTDSMIVKMADSGAKKMRESRTENMIAGKALKILHLTAQKPFATGSGTYLLNLIGALSVKACKQAVIYGIDTGEQLPEDAARRFAEARLQSYPVLYSSPELPFHVLGMSDVMPYPATRYRDLDENMLKAFEAAFGQAIKMAVEAFQPDLIFCQHLFLLSALVRRLCPDRPVFAFCHETGLIQSEINPHLFARIRDDLARLEGIFALQPLQQKKILSRIPIPASRCIVTGTSCNLSVFQKENSTAKRTVAEGSGDLSKGLVKKPVGKPNCTVASGKRVGNSRSLNVHQQDNAVNASEQFARPCRLIYAGKLSRLKGVDLLLRACRLLDPEKFSLTLIGDSSDADEQRLIEQLCASLTLHLQRFPRQDNAALPAFYAQADLFILPTLREGLAISILEALACGLPCLMSDLPGAPDGLLAHLLYKPEEKLPKALRFVPFPEDVSADPEALLQPCKGSEEAAAAFVQNLAESIQDFAPACVSRELAFPDMSPCLATSLADRILAACKKLLA